MMPARQAGRLAGENDLYQVELSSQNLALQIALAWRVPPVPGLAHDPSGSSKTGTSVVLIRLGRRGVAGLR